MQRRRARQTDREGRRDIEIERDVKERGRDT